MIPAFDEDTWYLPRGVHKATLAEIEDTFVASAPFAERRRIVFDSFVIWHRVVRQILPEAKFWVDGGFVTHKTWAPPSDVDVTVLVKPDFLNSVSESDQELLGSMFTVLGPPRRQPMSGFVDSFVCVRGDVDRTLFWREHWSTVLDVHKKEMSDRQKGFVEVSS